MNLVVINNPKFNNKLSIFTSTGGNDFSFCLESDINSFSNRMETLFKESIKSDLLFFVNFIERSFSAV